MGALPSFHGACKWLYHVQAEWQGCSVFSMLPASSPCRPNPCKNGGICIRHRIRSKFTCKCPEPFKGRFCEIGMSQLQGRGWGWSLQTAKGWLHPAVRLIDAVITPSTWLHPGHWPAQGECRRKRLTSAAIISKEPQNSSQNDVF